MSALIIVVVIVFAGAVATLVMSRLIERRHPPHGRFIDVHDLRRHIVELGKSSDASDGLPVVLLHGAGANLKDMEVAVGERLAAHHRVILVDRPGFGFSARKNRGENTPTEQAVVLDELFNRLNIERAIIVGHSWGGTLALTFALDYPQRVAGLVLLAPPTHPALRFFSLNAILNSPLGWLFAHTLALPFGALLIELGIRLAFLPQSVPPAYSKRSAAWLILRPASLMANWSDVGVLDAFLRKQVGRYGALRAPTIAFSGDRDPLVPLEKHAANLAELAPTVRVEVLAGFGHMLHHAAGDRIAAAVDEMSGSLREPGRPID
ncbi:MAG TPA: alpha/beta hydrolase [Xanthobacteraceae bacterium]|jgi:pimeloyl-ACP methyl ester carboxylesterase